MSTLNLLLWGSGILLIAIGYTQARGPYGRYRALQANDENLRRYSNWRGGRYGDAADAEVTGADVMRRQLRRHAQLWGAVAAVGFVLVFLGFALR